MSFLYHGVPKNLHGNILYPLNQLKTIAPEIYENARKKYVGREFIMDDKVPILNCLWNDVIHLSPVHPAEIKKELQRLGEGYSTWKFYQIDPNMLDKSQAVIYLYNQIDREHKYDKGNFIPFDPNKLDSLSKLPGETVAYYKSELQSGRKPLLYYKIPHILYKGMLDISSVPIVDV